MKSRKQAIAIGLSKARKKGKKVPRSPDRQGKALVSVAESKGDYKVRRLGLVKFQGAWSVVTPLPEVYDLGRLHPC